MSNSEEAPLKMANLAASLPNSDQALNSGNTGPCDDLKILTPQQASLWNSLSPKVRKQVLILREIQKQHDQFEAKFREEKAALEARYQKLYEPLYSKRYDIVNGHVEVDVTDGAAEENKEDGVPEFWLNAMKTNEVLALQITERDEGALKYLKDIRSSKTDSPKGFKLDFYFASNPYFKNPVLTKTYQMVEEDDDEPILERAIGTVIEWYPGKNLTQKVLKKKTAKGAKNSKPITKTEKCESFFNFFDPPEVPDDDDEIDDDVAEQLQETLEEDYDIGSTIRDKIIPHAVSWFTGEALQGEDFEDGDDDSEDDEGEGDEDDDDDDKEDGRGVTGRKPSASLTKPGQKVSMAQPADCKQQ